MSRQLVEVFEKTERIDPEQDGFHSSKSVISARISYIESDKGEHVPGVLMEHTKAFDSVSH